jgi:hypothetical protein
MLRAKIGTVFSNADISKTGRFEVAFYLPGDGVGPPRTESVRYVSPMGNSNQAFIAIPPTGSQVLCLYEDDIGGAAGDMMPGYYYVGSLMGDIPGLNSSIPPQDIPDKVPDTPYLKKDTPGIKGNPIPKGKVPMSLNYSPWPEKFRDMYIAKGVIPEQMGLTNARGDAFMISNRYNAASAGPLATLPALQDHRIGMHSGSGKRFELIDSGIVKGIVMETEHKGQDYFIWSTGSSEESPFSEGEYHMRTHGPVNMYSMNSNYAMWIEDGFNFEIKNNSTARLSYGDGKNGFVMRHPNADGTYEVNWWGINKGENGKPVPGGYKTTRKGKFGNETTGCVQLVSKHNNISLSALEVDSVIHIHAPGILSKVIIDTGGSVDIVAQGKITLQSKTEVEINAPKIDINAGKINGENEPPGNVYIDGDEVRINDPITDDMLDPPPEL